jgi:hypothetical protein
MEQSFINMLAGAVSVLFGWILKIVWDAVKDLQYADDELVDKVNRIEVLVAGEYVKREDFRADMERLFDNAEEFAALEQIKQAEDQLRELMQYYGRAGLWDDFVKFQAEARKARLLERNERIKKINQRWQYVSLIVAGCLGLIG